MRQFSLAEKAHWCMSYAIFRTECAQKYLKDGLLGSALCDLYEAQGLLSDALYFANEMVKEEEAREDAD